MLALVSPFIFPLTLISMLKKLIFGKSKLEKEAEAEQKAMEEAQRKAAEFMKTEGHEHINLAGKMGVGEDVNLDFNIDLNIDEKKDDKD
jgi:bacterioferritin (cytochrome b1)